MRSKLCQDARPVRATHISIIHRPFDPRIFHKECTSLARGGHEVHLIVGGSADAVHGVRLHSVARDESRPRARRQPTRFARATAHALRLWPSVYHLHDPHLIPLGVMLKVAGATVVYDVHEDYPAHARSKLVGHNLRGWLKAQTWRGLESLARRTFDGFVCASASVAQSFDALNTVVIGNFPRMESILNCPAPRPYPERANVLIGTGHLSRIRCALEIVEALELLPRELDCRLRWVGATRPPELEARLRNMGGWPRVEYLGFQPYHAVLHEVAGAKVGLALLHHLPNHTDAIRSNKLFEYMAAGIPVIAPNFSTWREIMTRHRCGLLVDPREPREIAAAIERLLTDPEQAEAMGARGREAVEREFNWAADERRLLSFYRRLLDRQPAFDSRPAVIER